ncbi:DUF4192 family protein [Microbacterium aquimaris]|uniref:DUF4192 family protein n=1 Tax=Microbacterium aquimaris TaxID=459816 RepID=UPI002AD528E2|nr:DUF4192 family protein [Microbacterium aquimaris]MDZ8276547.1 DUF4192 family protein [Microbacterium aquimaris]
MTSIVKAANAAEFLALVPRLAGYQPSESLVLVPFVGTRTAGVMRVDLPVGADADEIDRCAATFLGMVCRLPDVDGFAAIVYTAAGFAGGMPHRRLLDALITRADAAGLRVTDALCVAGDGWGSAFDPECPEGGHDLDRIERGAAAMPGLSAPTGDQNTGASLPAADLATKERVARALTQLDTAVRAVFGEASDTSGRIDPQALAAIHALDDLPALFEDVVEAESGTAAAFDLALLTWCLARPALRDVALVQWCGTVLDGDEALDAQARWEEGMAYPTELAERMWGEGASPDAERLLRALDASLQAAAAAPRDRRAGALATCAWLSWALGRSTHAGAFAEMAFEVEPDHGLAGIVLTMVGAGHLPAWAFRTPHTGIRPRTDAEE